jgi:hypothetical protein
MSRILKRPMFRKGGEVMEGIMTGIKPREMFEDKGMSDDMAQQLKNVQQKVQLIDAFSGAGANPLSNPLTQFLLQTGANLIGGTAAGGTKLQEIVGAAKGPLDKAIRAQQLRDSSRRRLAASLLAKTKPSETRRLFNALKNTINPATGKNYTFNEVAVLEARKDLFKKDTSAEEKEFQKGKETFKNLSSVKSFTGTRKYEPLEIELIGTANKQIDKDPTLFAAMDESKPYVQREDIDSDAEPVSTGKKDAEGKEIKLEVVIPEDPDEYTGNRVYYVLPKRKFFYFDAQKNRLVEYKRGG